MVNTTNDPQISMDEVVIDNADLRGALDDREAKKAGQKAYRAADKKAKEMIPIIEYAGKTLRVGPYRIKISETDEQEVSFTRGSGFRANITKVE